MRNQLSQPDAPKDLQILVSSFDSFVKILMFTKRWKLNMSKIKLILLPPNWLLLQNSVFVKWLYHSLSCPNQESESCSRCLVSLYSPTLISTQCLLSLPTMCWLSPSTSLHPHHHHPGINLHRQNPGLLSRCLCSHFSTCFPPTWYPLCSQSLSKMSTGLGHLLTYNSLRPSHGLRVKIQILNPLHKALHDLARAGLHMIKAMTNTSLRKDPRTEAVTTLFST